MAARPVSGALEIDRVVVNYGVVRVLKGVSLSIAPGEFVALLGSSGCGKTTLLRAISGFVPVASGRVLADGREITHAPPDKRDMAMVFQSYALWPHMTAAQNVGYGLRIRRKPRAEIEKRVAEMLRFVRLDGLGARRVTDLSGGQRQRVALARALAVSPRWLLLDEPLSNLDARVREEVRHEIKAIQQAVGITAIHVTHDREEAMTMADRIVILDAGEIAQAGPPEEVFNRPVSPFVASFMGATNTVPLTLAASGGDVLVAGGPHNFPARLAGRRGRVPEGAVVAHFRGGAATLVAPDAPAGEDAVVLHGSVAQVSYPGGFWRYAIAVGDARYLVDGPERLEPGARVGLRLPVDSLHVFARTGDIASSRATASVAA
jgi:ABC-type Fe3+/spermidine/putrescine transport system ATPase subunit